MSSGSSALVIDPSPAVRMMMRNVLSEIGVDHCDIAPSLSEGRKRLREHHYDIVLSEYNFETGESGQDMLEEGRKTGFLPPTTLYFIVTAEASYGTVVNIAEESPDDYLLKPLNTADLAKRVERAFAKRNLMLDVLQAMEQGKLETAVKLATQHMHGKGKFARDAARLCCQLLFRLGKYEESARLLKALLAQKDLPWARLVLARVAIRMGDHVTAEAALRELIAQHPMYLPVYTQLADVCKAQERFADALDVTEQAIKIAPNSVKRLQFAGHLATSLGDSEKGTAYLMRAVRSSGKLLDMDARTVYLLILAAQEKGDAKEALSMIKQMKLKAQEARDHLVIRSRLNWYAALAEAWLSLERREMLGAIDKVKFVSEAWNEKGFDLPLALDLFKVMDRMYADDLASTMGSWVHVIALRMCAGKSAQDMLESALSANQRLSSLVIEAGDYIASVAKDSARLMVSDALEDATDKLSMIGLQTKNNRLLIAAANAASRSLQRNNDLKYAALAKQCLSMVDPPDEELLARLKWVTDKVEQANT
ncbi:response regulator [Burkholderiaceae bacterium DAT-1]|nr:response regulator [Burkholderiaceae bacterium DAT-1]